jgi:hypothetical protein
VKRVPFDFEWPLGKTWDGFLRPDELGEDRCPRCEYGYPPRAEQWHDEWYGERFFSPAETGSVPFAIDHPVIRDRAERNIGAAPDYYGQGEAAIVAEAQRLADLFNRCWSHHLSQEDVDALAEAGRLYDLTHTWTRGEGWQPVDPPVHSTAAQVNEWSLAGFGNDSLNAHVVIEARCKREGVPPKCFTCEGHGTVERYEGQRAEAKAWKPTPPPVGEGWQVWETVTEGSPVSPVFATSDELADWIADPDRDTSRMWWVPKPVAEKFIEEGWAPSFVATPQTGLVSGVEAVGSGVFEETTEE